jgi:hypothetical protein
MTALLHALRRLSAEGLAPDEEQLEEKQKRISDHLVRLVQIYFGVVAGQTLVLYREVVVSPFDHDHIAAALALGSIYVMIVWSWIDWNTTMELRPYDFRPRTATAAERFVEHSERFRLYADIGIVTLYAYVLFQVAPLVGHPGADIRYLLLGYPIVFALYLASGFMRIIRYGSRASNVRPIIEYLGLFVALLVVYVLLRGTQLSEFWLNCATLAATVAATRAYRYRRRRYSEARKT